jgi:hypothetical protein
MWLSAASASADCSLGRSLLQCGEKDALYYDSVNAGIVGFASLDLFRAKRPLHLNNPALAAFWRYQSAAGIARYEYEFSIINQNFDQDFEEVPQAAKLSPPSVKRSGIVTRGMARAMTRLMRAEQQQIVNLAAMNTALDRASAAILLSRPDWTRYQTYVAAGFARRAAAAIAAVIPRERAVTKALVRARLLFGVGPADQRAAQRWVRKHGFPGPVRQIMLTLGMNPISIAFTRQAFLSARVGPTTFSVSKYLSAGSVVSNQKSAANALNGFANRIPAVPQPS